MWHKIFLHYTNILNHEGGQIDLLFYLTKGELNENQKYDWKGH